ncbi:type II toxin-antitoxin system Phd/YefM family antitoxin [Lactobacillus sp. ESL0228]|uniref:type II toxin-antitoxin system Phd/YefM family antitoxin n=1 Tax=Lactobacillus sp. ESL0228 TaxID=2069352 RepID=UPI001314B55D|nr:type II toxin-antitoxin system Phd/YefM family antitoxin [Lactobacillus sp. ESL0228]
MEAVSYTEFRRNFKHYILEVNEDSTALLVTNRDDTENDAVLLSKRDYDNIMDSFRFFISIGN